MNWRHLKQEIVDQKKSFILGVSGGVDSMFLLDFVSRLNVRVVVAHFDHGIHELSSDYARFVEDRAKHYEKEFIVGYGNINIDAASREGGLENVARTQRYAFLEKARVETGCDMIMTAHHLNDQIETIFLRLMRGCAHNDLCMQEHIYRPLINVEREEIENSVRNRKIPYKEDPTNVDISYDRNWLRLEILPQLMERRNLLASMKLGIELTKKNKTSG